MCRHWHAVSKIYVEIQRTWICQGIEKKTRKMVQINLFTKQKYRHRHTEQTYVHREGKVGGDKLGDQNWHIHTTMYSEVKLLSCVRLFATPWTVTYEVPPSVEFSRQEYWSGLPFPSPGDLPNPGIEPGSPVLQADAVTLWAIVQEETTVYDR